MKTDRLKNRISKAVSNIIAGFLVLIIRFYQISISRFLGGQCRFVPTCSQYAVEALEQFGVVKGTWLAIRRILKCNPLGPKGYDPLPSSK